MRPRFQLQPMVVNGRPRSPAVVSQNSYQPSAFSHKLFRNKDLKNFQSRIAMIKKQQISNFQGRSRAGKESNCNPKSSKAIQTLSKVIQMLSKAFQTLSKLIQGRQAILT
jgi:hypothetical protein